jgi:hypothetical protein
LEALIMGQGCVVVATVRGWWGSGDCGRYDAAGGVGSEM